MINFKAYVREQLNAYADYGFFATFREQLMNDYINSTVGEDIEDNDDLEYPEGEIHREYQRYLEFVEYLMLNVVMERKYTTRTQVVDYLMAKGLSEAFAKVAADQQYNYDPQPDGTPGDDLLRNGPENDPDFPQPITASYVDLDMVYDTWVELLGIDGDRITVDGEPMYDLKGNLVTD